MHRVIDAILALLHLDLSGAAVKLPFHLDTLFLASFWWIRRAVSRGRNDTLKWLV
jgi:hypothetical protein